MKKLLLLLLLHHGPATFDAWTTQRMISRGGVERNPLVRPFVHSPAVYLAVNADGLWADVLYLTGHKKAARVAAIITGASHIGFGVHNLTLDLNHVPPGHRPRAENGGERTWRLH